MSTISSASSVNSAGDGSAASQIAGLNKQIQAIFRQLKKLANDNTLTDEQKSEQQMIQSQIQMIEAQIAQIAQKQAEKAQLKQQAEQPAVNKADSINRPTDTNQINVYV